MCYQRHECISSESLPCTTSQVTSHFGLFCLVFVLLQKYFWDIYIEFIIFTGFAHRIIIITLDEELVYFLVDFSALVMKRGIEVEKV